MSDELETQEVVAETELAEPKSSAKDLEVEGDVAADYLKNS
jgi:hypothetical protein